MRYAKCDNCEADISGKSKYLLYKVSETKGKHRNSKQKAILRLCNKCGYTLYKYKQKKIERKTELSILYPDFNVIEPEKLCEYTDKCVHSKIFWKSSIERIMWISKTYCLSENKVNCERYKVMKTGKTPPEGLLVDGNRIELKT